MRRTLPTIVLLVLGAGVLAVLANGLPPQAFFAGDQGVKLVATRAALRHPSQPLRVDLPTIGKAPAPELLGTFYRAHGDHAHAVTSPLFPLLSAVPLGLFGLRGLYVLPALAWLLTLWLTARLSLSANPRASPAWATAVAASATPLLFYALEFWEHVPATALMAAAALVVVESDQVPRAWASAGLLTGAAFLLRPEALWYGAALALVWRTSSPCRGALLAGFAAAISPLATYSLVHFGTLAGPHLSSNALGALDGWAAARWHIVQSWFLGGASLAPVTVAILIALLSLAPEKTLRLRHLLAVAVAVGTVVGAITGSFPREGLWATCPVVGLALAPLGRHESPPGALVALRRAALAFVLLAWLTAPNDGGAQWGPRYLLPACVPLAVVVAEPLRRLREVWRPAWIGTACGLALLLSSLWVQRSSYRDLRVAKRIHARIVEAVTEHASSARAVLSDLWWLDQLAAASATEPAFLYADSPEQARLAVRRLARQRVSPVLVVRSASASPGGPTEEWLAGSCYAAHPVGTLRDRELSFVLISCASSVPTAAAEAASTRAELVGGGPRHRGGGSAARD